MSLGDILDSVVDTTVHGAQAAAGIPVGAEKRKKVRHAYVVGASMYGGPSDPTSGHNGADGTRLDGTMSFAELGMGRLLGNLPMGTELYIGYKGKVIKAVKHDIGLGGVPVEGHSRRIDLWYETANALGFSGTGLVTIARVDGGEIKGPNDTAQSDVSSWGQFGATRAAVKAGGAVGDGVAGVLRAMYGLLSKIFSIRGLEVAVGIALILASVVLLARKSALDMLPIPVK